MNLREAAAELDRIIDGYRDVNGAMSMDVRAELSNLRDTLHRSALVSELLDGTGNSLAPAAAVQPRYDLFHDVAYAALIGTQTRKTQNFETGYAALDLTVSDEQLRRAAPQATLRISAHRSDADMRAYFTMSIGEHHPITERQGQ